MRGRIPNIPPNVDNWEIGGEVTIKEAITLYAFAPHMHLRGKDIKYTLIWPDGRQQVLFNVPKFDFNWQLHYELAEPLRDSGGQQDCRGRSLRQLDQKSLQSRSAQRGLLERAELGRDVHPLV